MVSWQWWKRRKDAKEWKVRTCKNNKSDSSSKLYHQHQLHQQQWCPQQFPSAEIYFRTSRIPTKLLTLLAQTHRFDMQQAYSTTVYHHLSSLSITLRWLIETITDHGDFLPILRHQCGINRQHDLCLYWNAHTSCFLFRWVKSAWLMSGNTGNTGNTAGKLHRVYSNFRVEKGHVILQQEERAKKNCWTFPDAKGHRAKHNHRQVMASNYWEVHKLRCERFHRNEAF